MSSSASSSRSSTPEPPTKIHSVKRKRKEPEPEPEPEESAQDDPSNDCGNSEPEDEPMQQDEGEEERVLSHAEKRRKKREERLAAKQLKDAGASAKKKQKLKDGSAKDVSGGGGTVGRKNSVWVGNMSFKTTLENLRAFFKDVGDISRINMPTKAPAGPGLKPENRGFAYVDFETAEAKKLAIEKSEQPLLGRKLLIKDGDDFAGRPAAPGADLSIKDPVLAKKSHSKTAQKILRAQKQPPAPTLFFGNLGFETTEDSIRELLEAHRSVQKKGKAPADADDEGKEKNEDEKEKAGEVWIRKIRMGTFEDTGKCKGFAFVDFSSIENATGSLINPKNHHLNGRNLVVEYAGAEAVRRGAPKQKHVEGDAPPKRPRKSPRSIAHAAKAARALALAASNETEPSAESPGKDFRGQPPHIASSPQKSEKYNPKKPVEGETERNSRHQGPRTRPKPGAALALAKRESAAIIPSQGRKITF